MPSVTIVKTSSTPQGNQEADLMRRAFAVLTLVVCTVVLAGCGDDDSSGSSEGTDLPTKTIDVSITGDSVTPNGDRVSVQVNQPIELVVKADAEGEIHVHSDPEQEFEYPAGKSEQTIEGIDKPGTVDVESHTLDKVIVQLEVR